MDTLGLWDAWWQHNQPGLQAKFNRPISTEHRQLRIFRSLRLAPHKINQQLKRWTWPHRLPWNVKLSPAVESPPPLQRPNISRTSWTQVGSMDSDKSKLRLVRRRQGPSEDLRRYRRGEITEATYLQSRIDVATTHLKGRLSTLRLAMLKEVIAQRLQTDPSLLEARTRLLRKPPTPKKAEVK